MNLFKFWNRQFLQEATIGQMVFDILFGIVFPIFYLVVDFIIFERRVGEFLIQRQFLLFGYIEYLIGLFILGYCLAKPLQGHFITGILMAQALVSLGCGLMILPISFLSLFVGVGILGFTPFLTSFVFLRNAVRVFKRGVSRAPGIGARAMIVGFCLTLALPAIGQLTINRTVDTAIQHILSGHDRDVKNAIIQLKRIGYWADLQPLMNAYMITEQTQKRKIAEVYAQLTGRNIEIDLRASAD